MKCIGVTRRLNFLACVLSLFSVFCAVFAVDSTAVGASVSSTVPHAGGAQLSGISWSAADDDLAFAPFQPTQSHDATSNNLPSTLQAMIRQVFPLSDSEHVQIFHSQHVATLPPESKPLGLFPSALFADVWVAESYCRPGFAITWIDLWAEFPVEASATAISNALHLVLAVPGTANVDTGAFGSTVRLADDRSLHSSSRAEVWSWSGWYVQPTNDVPLISDTDAAACFEAASTTEAFEYVESPADQVWIQFADEVNWSQVTIAIEGADEVQDGIMSLGAVAIVAGNLIDADSALAWAHRLSDWTHGETEPRAELHVESLVETTIVATGDTLVYGYRLTNLGAESARHAALQLPLPRELRYVADSGAPSHGAVAWDDGASLLSWDLGPTLLPGEVATLTFQVIVQ